jgi:hypothetical protein
MSMHPRYLSGRFVLVLVLAAAIGGCRREEPIVQYSVARRESVPETDVEGDRDMATKSPTDRMLAAIILQDNRAWFLKGTGRLDQFGEQTADQFVRLVESLRCPPGAAKPSWELPAGWSELPGSQMRVAEFRVGDVEFSVIPLPVPAGDRQDYVLSNVNRWRNQLGLAPLALSEMPRLTTRINTADGREAVLADWQGRLDSGSLPPMARSGPPATNPGAGGLPPTAPRGPLQYQTPAGWRELPASGMRAAAFQIGDGDNKAEMTVIVLGGAAGGLLPNVNRWRDQVGLPSLASEDEIKAEPVPTGGGEAKFIRIEGTSGRGMLAAILPRDGRVWFFKLMGDQSVTDQQQDAFKGFLESVRFQP